MEYTYDDLLDRLTDLKAQQIVEGEGCPEGFRHQDGCRYGSGHREDDGRPSVAH